MIAKLNHTELFYLIKGSGKPCMVMHGGLGLDHSYFIPYLNPLEKKLKLIYYDMRGNGRSGRPPITTYTHENFVQDAEALRQYLSLSEPILLGHSYGGAIAMEYAVRYPDKLTHLILVCTTPSYEFLIEMMKNFESEATPEMRSIIMKMRWPNDEEFKQDFKTILPLYFYRAVPASFIEIFNSIIFSKEVNNYVYTHCVPNYDVRPYLKKIKIPTLIIGGRYDLATPISQSKEINRYLPNSELVIFEESGHFPFVEEQNKFTQTILDWLERHDAL